MATTRIKDLSKTATTVNSDANLVLDGNTGGTQKISRDNFRQDTADAFVAAPGTYNLAPLNSGTGKIDAVYLSSSSDTPKGAWDASTNTPTLADGSGTAGDYYDVTVAGSSDLGSGSIAFTVGDVVKYNGTVWFKIDSVANILDGVSTIDGAKTAIEIPDVSTAPNEVPLNGQLGTMAYQSAEAVSVDKLEVTDSVTGNLKITSGNLEFGSSTDLKFFHDGSNGYIQNTTGNLLIKNVSTEYIKMLVATGGVELYHNGTKQCETSATGLSLPSGKGIDFGSTSSGFGTPSGGLLNDYEEGTFTIGTAGDATGAISHQYGQYVKVGRVVTVRLTFRVSANFTGNRIDGLPFNAQCPNTGSLSGIGGGFVAMTSNVNASPIFAINTHGTDEISFMSGTSTGALHVINTTNSIYRITATYETTI